MQAVLPVFTGWLRATKRHWPAQVWVLKTSCSTNAILSTAMNSLPLGLLQPMQGSRALQGQTGQILWSEESKLLGSDDVTLH